MFKLVDLLWIAAAPLYLLIGTARHEGSHALVALMEGAKVAKFVFWPTERGWGYVLFPPGSVTWQSYSRIRGRRRDPQKSLDHYTAL